MQTDLTGKLLIAMPSIGDTRFSRSVILMCAHAPEFAMGIVVNKPMQGLTLPHLLGQLDVPMNIDVPNSLVLDGGPVSEDRGFVIHTSDVFSEKATLEIDDALCMTATREILETLAGPDRPENSVLALGYAGWGAGQLEQELAENAWLVGEPSEALVFGDSHGDKWTASLEAIGIDARRLQSGSGHA